VEEMTLSQRYNLIADRLSQHIPAPKVKPAKVQLSWRTLRLEQRLELKQRWFKPGCDLPPGSILTISRVTSRGIELTVDPAVGKMPEYEGLAVKLTWTDPEWAKMFTKLKKGKTNGKPRSKKC